MHFSRRRFAHAALLVVFALGACAGRPHGVLIPIETVAPGAHVVDMLVATTRTPDRAEPAAMFSGGRARSLSFADIAVSLPPQRVVGEVQWPANAAAPDPTREFATVRADILDENAAIAAFNARIRKTPLRQALVFVHGYNTRFEEAVYRFAQIVHDAETSALPVLFTWPSRGKLLAYGYDHESASYSRDALEALLQALARDPKVGEVSILAHSMGNWATLEALRQMSIRNRGLPAKIRNVMLAAPDVDFDVFRRQIAQIGERRALFTLFVARDDNALAASRRVWGNELRVGAIDPTQPPFKDALDKDHIQAFDLTSIPTDDPARHTRFAESPAVVRAIGLRLAQGQPLSDSQMGVGDRVGQIAVGAGATMGAAAGAAVAAPFVVFDPRTQDSLGERLESVGEHASQTLAP